jgi:N-acetylmuramoyl-L-alanine amidase
MTKLRVLVQAGHIAPREPGFESGTGTVREQEFTRLIRDKLIAALREDGRFEPIAVPGDIPDGVRVDAALFEHGDGSASKSASGFSFGYPDDPVNKRLADLIASEYLKLPGHPPHHPDNYTPDLRGYYGYRRVISDGPEVLVESGFLTNPSEQAWMFANVDHLAAAQYRALLRYFGLPASRSNDWNPGDPLWLNLPGPRPEAGLVLACTRGVPAAREDPHMTNRAPWSGVHIPRVVAV